MTLFKNTGGKTKKMTKKKIFVVALAICLLTVVSMGTLAWFSASDSVKNNFYVAGSEDGNPDEIFSVDVWEDLDNDGKKDEGEGEFFDILPGDELDKVVHVENTGSYNQYIRVKISVSNASIWQDVYDADMVPVTEFVDVDLNAVYGVGSYLENDSFVYYLYYTKDLPFADDNDEIIVFNHVNIAEELTKEQAALLKGKFDITVTADAVQTKNVGTNVYEAFKTVGMEVETNTVWVDTEAKLLEALANGGYIVMTDNIKFSKENVTINTNANLYLGDYQLATLRKNNGVYGIIIEKDADLTIGGLGTVYMPGAQGIYLNGTLNVYGGTWIDDKNQSNDDESLINIYETGILNVYDGTFNGYDYCVNVRNGNGVANIVKGVFTVVTENGETIKD